MPELPEVETVVRGLRASISGRRIASVRFGKTDFVTDPAGIAERLPGSRIASIERYGKFIGFTLEPESTGAPFHLIVHLGMTGQLIPQHSGAPIAPHTHAFFALDDGRELRYTDSRRFGQMLVLSQPEMTPFAARLGADPLEIAAAEFASRLGARHARIKALLLDQNVLRGMGNIYADESLWRARIHPARLAVQLKPAELVVLHRAMQKVLNDAIRLRGSSISDFLDAEGAPGEYQLHHRVYGRAGKLCPRCKTAIRRIVVAGRGSYFCPRCQKPPGKRRVKSRVLKPAKPHC